MSDTSAWWQSKKPRTKARNDDQAERSCHQMNIEQDRLAQTLQKVDELDQQDPNKELVGGREEPRELIYSKRLSDWVLKLNPNASEILKIAARGQHIQRWMIPRDRYPQTRIGYLQWREELKKFHAQKVSEIMQKTGYPDDAIQKASSIILKKNLRTDPDAQTIEDALCLLFLEIQFEDLKQKTHDEKMREIVRKTWKKMSPRAQKLALSLPLSEPTKHFLQKTLATTS